jgi:hypothetical protein
VPDSLKLDHGICDDMKSIVTVSKAELHELQRGHQKKTKEISGGAGSSLGDDYKVSNRYSFFVYLIKKLTCGGKMPPSIAHVIVGWAF